MADIQLHGGHVTPVVLCGGVGERLWPLSTHERPKPFLSELALGLGRRRDNSLFQQTSMRMEQSGFAHKPLVVTSMAHEASVVEQLQAIDISASILLEPEPANTAMAIAVSALHIQQCDPNRPLLILPSDHLITETHRFTQAVRSALSGLDDHIVTFGVKPHDAATSYGYLQPCGTANMCGFNETSAQISGFVEKPTRALAHELVTNDWLWNSGIFLVRANTVVDQFEKHAADILACARDAIAGAISSTLGNTSLLGKAYENVRNVSFDRAIMENTDLARVHTANFDWHDLGTWPGLMERHKADQYGNRVVGPARLRGNRNSVHSPQRPTILLDVDDLLVVNSDDLTIVTRKDRMGAVRKLANDGRFQVSTYPSQVENMNDECHDEIALAGNCDADTSSAFCTQHKPWGTYEVICSGTCYQVKRLTVHNGARLSLQRHEHRAEKWVVVAGEARVTIDHQTLKLTSGETVSIARGAVHRLENCGDGDLVVIETQLGTYLGEDDIERYCDDYGRLETLNTSVSQAY